MKVLFEANEGLIYPGRDNDGFVRQTAHRFEIGTTAWYRVEDQYVFSESGHPDGRSDRPHFVINGVRVYTTEHHPSNRPGRAWFMLR